ncbi:hypothetical protein K458DRAFT_287498, partial [Lentithecium fluviatile CBS 122367]
HRLYHPQPPRMAQSTFASRELESEDFVESCGAILFDFSEAQKKVCLVRTTYNKEWLLAKGRRNHGESRKDAALREVMEETGYRCKLLPVTMRTRATPPDARADIKNQARVYEGLTEPFWCTVRTMKKCTKIIWWYIAVLDDHDAAAEKLPGEEKLEPEFMDCSKALETLTYQSDRDLLAKAIKLVDDTLFGKQNPGKQAAGKEAPSKALGDTHSGSQSGNQSGYVLPRKRKMKAKESNGVFQVAKRIKPSKKKKNKQQTL